MGFFYQGEVIVSRQNRRVVDLCKLEDRKARQAQKRFRFDGVKLFCEAVIRDVPLVCIYLRKSSIDRVENRFRELTGRLPEAVTCPAYVLSDELFDRISTENAPEGIICVAEYIDRFHKMYIIKKEAALDLPEGPVLLLESVRDPLNVGAVIRTAAALGIQHLMLSDDCADLYHPKTLRAAMGPLFSLPVTRASGRRVFAAALDESAVKLGDLTFKKRDCVVIGNEGHGLSEGLIRACTQSIYIPMQGDTESLNAGVAAALLMWELCKSNM